MVIKQFSTVRYASSIRTAFFHDNHSKCLSDSDIFRNEMFVLCDHTDQPCNLVQFGVGTGKY